MYRVPSSLQRNNKEQTRLNLIPILDSVFIFIFFLLVSANFMHLKEISSDIPFLSNALPDDKEPLALTLKISSEKVRVYTGMGTKHVKTLSISSLEDLHSLIIEIKESNQEEKTIIFEPTDSVAYEKIVELMDAVRMTKDNNELFSNIVFSNIME